MNILNILDKNKGCCMLLKKIFNNVTIDGNRCNILKLCDAVGEYTAYDTVTENTDNHIYPKSEGELVYIQLEETEENIHGIGYRVVNILPYKSLKGEKPNYNMDDFYSQDKVNLKPKKVRDVENTGEPTTVLLISKSQRKGTKGIYYEITFTDKEIKTTAKDFDCLSENIPDNSVVSGVFTNNEKYGYNVSKLKIVNSMDAKDFIRHPPVEEQKMYDAIVQMLSGFLCDNKTGIATLALDIYRDLYSKIIYWSAGKTMHHSIYGGLLYHTYRMMQTAKGIASVYYEINDELLLTAVALHDIGKLYELETDKEGNCKYTVMGNLMGHAAIGIEIINEYATRRDYNSEDILLLKHCIASHHGELEYGAIVKPSIIEAFLLNIVDVTDSRIYMFEDEYNKLQPGTFADKKAFGLDTAVYRPEFTVDSEYLVDYTE